MTAAPLASARRRGRRPTGHESGRAVLLRYALISFAGHGYDGTSLRGLAADAGVDMALVARVFGSKASLWEATIDDLAAHRAEYDQVIAGLAKEAQGDPHGAVTRFILLFTQISFEMPAFPALLLQEASIPGDRNAALVEKLVRPFKTACRPIVEAGIKAGVLAGEDPDFVLGMLMTAISVPLVSPLVFIGPLPRDAHFRDKLAAEAIATFVRKPSSAKSI